MVELWNWAKTFHCRPRLYIEPTSIDSLRTILNEISRTKSKVRVIGCAHSPSGLSMSNEVLISMKNFNRIIDIDEKNLEIHCESGVLLSTLNDILPKHNLSLPVQGSISTLTIAGAISTATHGSGMKYGTLSSYVRSISLMKLNGELKEYHYEDDKDLFHCLACSLGTFAIIVSIRLQVSPSFHLELNQYMLEFRSFVNTLSIHYSSSDHFRYMWYPYTNSGIAYHLTRILPRIINNNDNNSLFSRIWSWFKYSLIDHHLLELLFYFSLYIPCLVRYINNIYLKLNGKSNYKIDRCDKLFNFDCLFYQYANEWAIPLDRAVLCLIELEKLFETYTNVHFPIEIRFSKEDSSYLSPAYQRKTCWLNTVAYRPYGKNHFQHRSFFIAFESICYKHHGRPHWAKEHPLTNESFSKIYPKWTLFHQIRKEFDPDNLFVNDYLQNMFP